MRGGERSGHTGSQHQVQRRAGCVLRTRSIRRALGSGRGAGTLHRRAGGPAGGHTGRACRLKPRQPQKLQPQRAKQHNKSITYSAQRGAPPAHARPRTGVATTISGCSRSAAACACRLSPPTTSAARMSVNWAIFWIMLCTCSRVSGWVGGWVGGWEDGWGEVCRGSSRRDAAAQTHWQAARQHARWRRGRAGVRARLLPQRPRRACTASSRTGVSTNTYVAATRLFLCSSQTGGTESSSGAKAAGSRCLCRSSNRPPLCHLRFLSRGLCPAASPP